MDHLSARLMEPQSQTQMAGQKAKMMKFWLGLSLVQQTDLGLEKLTEALMDMHSD